MKKIIAMIVMVLSVSVVALAGGHNPFDEMYKTQAHKEMQRGVAQYNFMVINEVGVAVPDVVLNYVNHDSKLLTAKADAGGKVHIEFRQPNFIQLVSVVIDNVEYRIIGDDTSDDVDAKDISKGDVEYYVIQKNTANKCAYLYDAD